MQDIFITKIKINEVRNIKDFEINLSETERKHLIITGKNGSGKTSLLEALKTRLTPFANHSSIACNVVFNYISSESMNVGPLVVEIDKGEFILKFFGAKRSSQFIEPKGINKVEFKIKYEIDEMAGSEFTQHIVNLQFDRLVAKDENDSKGVENIENWFETFEKELSNLFDEPNLKLVFDRKKYQYQIVENGNPPYTFNQLPDGFSSILDIVTELIMRMGEHKSRSYDVQGIVLIDELETHLHIDLQKKILQFLTSFFPKIQFIVTTHSPFVIQSVSNAVICDLEKRIVTEDLSGYSWDAIIESYFDSDKYSDKLKEKVERYEELLEQNGEGDKDELFEIKKYLNEIPKFVSDELAVKLQQLKLKEIAKKHK
jgi:predicted ATP-dependent endonuclease of OLD family